MFHWTKCIDMILVLMRRGPMRQLDGDTVRGTPGNKLMGRSRTRSIVSLVIMFALVAVGREESRE